MTVTITSRRFASTVRSPNQAVTTLIKRLVPSTRREYLPDARQWLVYATAVPGLVDGLRAAGHHVDVVDTTVASGGRE